MTPRTGPEMKQRRIRKGRGRPRSALGKDGDFYVDTTTGDVYRKLMGAWAVTGNIATNTPASEDVTVLTGKGVPV